MIRLVPALLLLLAACGESGLPEPRNDEVRVTGGGIGVDISGTAQIGVSGSYD
ncbi:hypothetical protein SAMN04488020_105184 [Palleronia marisminoris]|uniref:Uncharacterized protein n=1 Tax=Palleronia marisminoris TaxID=315423 RepID=A0A1Y5STF9_9RHOB|nr:hypothetical protein [Palleronia marisminoris]SFG97409.1 hypothetical protein SAMN04488020_105184 [Palleronia marisminoris]SLN47711.1 hypothetical protein PAM7066_02128 [Palleronia marisminoris]